MDKVPNSTIPLKSWLVLMAVGVLIFIMNIDYTAVNLTLVPIADEIHADLNSLQWLLSGYVLVWAAFVIPAGRAADLYGKRRTLIIGLLIFMTGSYITAIGQNIEVLIGGRLLQGVGAALFTAPAWASIYTLAPPEKQGFVMGFIMTFAGLGLATGPTLAGVIIEEASWRWIFYINIPLGFLVIAILMLWGTKDELPPDRPKIDYIGTLLLAAGLCISVYGINQIEIWGFSSSLLWGVLALGALFILSYILYDRTCPIRMIPPRLFKSKSFLAATFGEFFMAINFSLILVMMGLYLQNTLNYSSYETGLIFISMTITMGALSPVGGKLIDTFGLKEPMVFGALCTAASTGMMIFLNAESSLIYVIVALFLAGTGLGAYFTSCSIAMMRSAPQEDLNVASGVFTMFMMLGNTLSVILSTSLLVLFGQSRLLEKIQSHGLSLSAPQHHELVEVIGKVDHTPGMLKAFPADQVPLFLDWITESFVYGFSINMLFGTLFAFIATGLTLWGIQSKRVEKAEK